MKEKTPMTFAFYRDHICHLGHSIVCLPRGDMYLSSLPGAGWLIYQCYNMESQ